MGLMMSGALVMHAGLIRMGAFFAVLAAMAVWETLAPRRVRALPHSRRRRWPGNLGITFLNGALLRFILPAGALTIAAAAVSRHVGLLQAVRLPFWFVVLASVVLLDLAIYLQHVLFHAVPLLWRLHRMHHADLDLDVSSGGRFHSIEILLSALIKMAAVASLGAPPVAVITFEVLLNATSMFNHANARLPPWLDRTLRLVLVTPDMHRVHHSIDPAETNSNFGFSLPWWDYVFATYRAAPRLGQHGMILGIEQFRNPADERFDRMWLIPFRGPTGAYPLSGRAYPVRPDIDR